MANLEKEFDEFFKKIDLSPSKEEELRKILQEFIDLDYKSKNGQIDINIGLESVLCRYCS